MRPLKCHRRGKAYLAGTQKVVASERFGRLTLVHTPIAGFETRLWTSRPVRSCEDAKRHRYGPPRHREATECAVLNFRGET